MDKNLLFAFVVLLIFFKTVQAQTIDYAAKAGVNISTFYGKRSGDKISRNSLIGFHAGVSAQVKLNENIALQPELLFSRVGSEEENIVKFQLDYITVPLMAKFYIGEKLSFDVGPQFGFLVNDTARFRVDGVPDFDTDANTFDFALNTGLSIDFFRQWFVQVRYSYGLATVSENPDVTNGVFQTSLGYRF